MELPEDPRGRGVASQQQLAPPPEQAMGRQMGGSLLGAQGAPAQGMQPMPGQKPPTSYQNNDSLLSKLIPLILGAGAVGVAARRGELGDAIQGLAGGFAKQKVENALTDRRRKADQEDFMIKQAHEAVGDLPDLGEAEKNGLPAGMSQRIRELQQKHAEALANDGVITPKEASEILAIRHSIDAVIKRVKSTQDATNQAMGQRDADVASRAADIFESGEYIQPPPTPGLQTPVAGAAAGAPGAPGAPGLTRTAAPELGSPIIGEQAQRQASRLGAVGERRALDRPVSVSGPGGTRFSLPGRDAAGFMSRQATTDQRATSSANRDQVQRERIKATLLANSMVLQQRQAELVARGDDSWMDGLVDFMAMGQFDYANPKEQPRIAAAVKAYTEMRPGAAARPGAGPDSSSQRIINPFHEAARKHGANLKPGESVTVTVLGKPATVKRNTNGELEVGVPK